MKQKIAFGAALLVLGLAAESVAQPVPPFYRGMGMELPPREIMMIVREAGLDPVSRPVLRGGAYTVLALDTESRVVRVEIGARRGRILRIAPASTPRYADIPPSYSRPPGLIPDDYNPDDLPNAGPADIKDPPPTAPGSVGEQAIPGRRSALSHPPTQAATPPLPRPRPRLAATDSPAASPKTVEPAVPPARQGADTKQAAIAEQGTDAKQGADATQGANLKQGGEANPGAQAREATGTIATSTTPPWQRMEQQE